MKKALLLIHHSAFLIHPFFFILSILSILLIAFLFKLNHYSAEGLLDIHCGACCNQVSLAERPFVPENLFPREVSASAR
jgi:hypothetical protein